MEIRRLRWWLVAACVIASVPLLWRVSEVAGEVRRDRLAATAYQRGRASLDKGDLEGASRAFREAIVLSPKEVEPYRSLAEAEFKRGKIDEAITAYRHLMAIYPYTYMSPLYWETAIIEMSAGRLEDARRDLRLAVTINPNDWRAYYFLGIVSRQLGDIPGARAAWQRVIVLQPGFQLAYEQLRRLDTH